MTANNIFSAPRFINLSRRHLALNYKAPLIVLLGAGGLIAIISALGSIGQSHFHTELLAILFFITLFIAGYALSSGIFSELHKPETSIHYLTLPASAFEKFLVAWLSTTVVYLAISWITFYIIYFISSVMALWWFGVSFSNPDFFNESFLKMAHIYIAAQSVFFFGAVYFKGKNFGKTILSLFLLSIGFSLFQTLISSVAFREIMVLMIEHKGNIENMVAAPGLEEYMETYFLPVVEVGFYYVIPAFFIGLSYLKLTEREV